MKVVIYTRVSTDEQADKGYSLRQQKDVCERHCEIKGYDVLKHFEDDYSAKTFNRPDWKKLEAYVKANKKDIDKLLFAKWDRFSRNMEESLRIIRLFRSWGVEVNAIEQPLDLSNPDNKAMLALYLVMPEVENDKISQRTINGINQARKEGAYTSKAPFGFRNAKSVLEKSTLEHTEHANTVREIFDEISQGVSNVEGVRVKYISKGYNKCKQSFYNMLRNKVYIGKVLVPENKKMSAYWVDGLHDGIVDEVTFNKVQNVLDGKVRNARFPSRKHELLPLRGYLICPICNGNLTGSVSKGNGGEYAYYHCRKQCPNRILAKTVHSLFNDLVVNIQLNDNITELFKTILSDVIKKYEGDKDKLIETRKREINQQEIDIETLEDKLVSGEISNENFNKINKRYTERLMDLRSDLEEVKNRESNLKYVDGAVEFTLILASMFDEADYDEKINLLGLLFPEKIYVSKDECRTNELNEVIELISRFNVAYRGIEKEKADINIGLSIVAPSPGLEPGTL